VLALNGLRDKVAHSHSIVFFFIIASPGLVDSTCKGPFGSAYPSEL